MLAVQYELEVICQDVRHTRTVTVQHNQEAKVEVVTEDRAVRGERARIALAAQEQERQKAQEDADRKQRAAAAKQTAEAHRRRDELIASYQPGGVRTADAFDTRAVDHFSRGTVKLWPTVTAGVGVVGITAGVLLRSSAQHHADLANTPGYVGGQLEIERARGTQTQAIVVLGAGPAGLITGAIWWLASD